MTTIPLTRDVPTCYGVLATGLPLHIVAFDDRIAVVDLGLERHPIRIPIPLVAFADPAPPAAEVAR